MTAKQETTACIQAARDAGAARVRFNGEEVNPVSQSAEERFLERNAELGLKSAKRAGLRPEEYRVEPTIRGFIIHLLFPEQEKAKQDTSPDAFIYDNARRKVYFIQPENMNVVKIGIATNLKNRLQSLQTAHFAKLRVIGCMRNPRLEFKLHARFSEYRLQGEWFRLEGEVLEYIRRNAIKVKRPLK